MTRPAPSRISEIYLRGEPVFSFEFFPPKTDKGAQSLMQTAADLAQSVEPDFISVTYGAGGSTRDRTHEIVTRIQSELGVTGLAHLTCVGATSEEIGDVVGRLEDAGVRNVLALRGDAPEGTEGFEATEGGFAHASDLIAFLSEDHDVCIGGACYPEAHPEATSAEADLAFAKLKQDAGASFLTTQLFFDVGLYSSFVERARAAGVTIPIVPGIMPVTNVSQVERFTRMCGASIPEELLDRLRPVQEDAGAVIATGIEWAITQCRDQLAAGAPGIHFYTLNKSHATRSILAALR
ncbi:MAG: methylenetetrahydrofolate reductase [NAD(P)H] [Planctomycetota bacterium]|nr:methylenetetrahydrofolate reductase [NAD(P)H] [Planctomycetota bacterium]